ncbi:JAB-like toxin 1 domain-containing protein [Frigoriflavimonas asaccharolytica]|uniref:JAB-like toxin 1 domain-containing protein n=1 Tax=Frigoriflavimonas asaccharolytica TaxID=2735899 RepID=UPI00293BFBF6|nr:JAB-like toxin 1 domain-containing protein [Frigoriflavimonas asaccharolytica]
MPDGRGVLTDYKLSQNGNVERVDKKDGTEADPTDTLFATNIEGTVDKSNSITLDKGIIDQLQKSHSFGNTDATKNVSYSVTEKGEQAFDLFQFTSQNSIVEWKLSSHFENSKFVLNTSHDDFSDGVGWSIIPLKNWTTI